MNENAKTEAVNSTKRLLELFLQTVGKEEFYGFSIRTGAISNHETELRLEALGKKSILLIVPRLNPSRKLLSQRPELGDIVVCPQIPDLLAEDLRREGINHADLNGRLFIKAPFFLLDRNPKTKRYRNPSSPPKLFTLKTSRLIRALLSHRETTWTQEVLAERTQVSRTLISLALAALIDEEFVTLVSSGNRHRAATYRLKAFDPLLDAWRAADRWDKRVVIHQYSLLTNDLGELARTVRDGLGADQVCFTQWWAAHLRHPYTTPPLVSAYVKSKRLLDLPLGRKVTSGGNLWLLTPTDEGVFQETQVVDGFTLVSDIQIYLDLLAVSQRGPEQATELRKWEGFAR
jgi:hypothetical protein